MHKTLLGLALFPMLIVIMLIVGLSCGPNPPFAPAGSIVTITNPPGDITIPLNTTTTIPVQAFVTEADGVTPLNDVRVDWDLSFANPQSLVIDTNGDGVGDTPALQLIDPNACGNVNCEDLTIPELFAINPLPFVKSPWHTQADNRGISNVLVLINGNVHIQPATIQVSLENGSVAVVTFNVNAQ